MFALDPLDIECCDEPNELFASRFRRRSSNSDSSLLSASVSGNVTSCAEMVICGNFTSLSVSPRSSFFSSGPLVQLVPVSTSLFLVSWRGSGVHQYTGNCRCMLLITRPTMSIKTAPNMIRPTKYQPISVISGDVAASTAEAPPGGWTVPVRSMTAEAAPHETAPAIHFIFSKSERRRKSFVIPTPMMAEKAWPRRAFRGCPNGERIALYSKMAEAPFSRSARGQKRRIGSVVIRVSSK